MAVQEDYSQWYDSHRELYDSLRKNVRKLVRDRLHSQGPKKGSHYVFIGSRSKNKDSFIKKLTTGIKTENRNTLIQ